jgi:hypothetical protein
MVERRPPHSHRSRGGSGMFGCLGEHVVFGLQKPDGEGGRRSSLLRAGRFRVAASGRCDGRDARSTHDRYEALPRPQDATRDAADGGRRRRRRVRTT